MKTKRVMLILALMIIIVSVFLVVKVMNPSNSNTLKKANVELNTEQLEGNHIQIVLQDGVSLVSMGYDFQLEKQETLEKINAQDKIYEFGVHANDELAGNLEVVVRTIDNKDKLVFSRFDRVTEDTATIPLKIVFQDEKKYDFFQFEEEIEQEHDRVFGIDYTTNVKGLYSIGSTYNLFLSQNYISNERHEQYEDGKESVLRELVNEDTNISIDVEAGNLVYDLELRSTEAGQISENWFLLSDEKLFSSKEAAQQYKKETNYNFISSRKWLTSTGTFTKLPWSVEPATKLAYGRNLVVMQGTPFIKNYEEQEERFYYNMIVNSANYLWDFKQDTKLWETEYTSTWLKKDYGIIAPYTDTRHNENIALFLNKAGDILHNDELKESYLLYADFLSSQEDIDNILRTDNGYYILDYYSDVQTKKTHVSLNHALGEMSYLFTAYRQTKNDEYLQVALKIKQAVEDIGEQWINESNGDLWYQINGDYSFEGKDYDTLTLRDIVTSLTYYEEFQLPYGDIYETLMATKIDFIIDNKVDIEEPLYEQLLALGFEDKLEDYEHVIRFKK